MNVAEHKIFEFISKPFQPKVQSSEVKNTYLGLSYSRIENE